VRKANPPPAVYIAHLQGFEGVAGATNKELRDSDGREMVSAPGTSADLMGGEAKDERQRTPSLKHRGGRG